MAFPEVGDTLDIFDIRSKLHEGALATIFLAEDQLSREQVVLKIPCGDILNQPIILYHYQNEERISRLLNHPGIVRFIHRQRSRQYIIMENLSGQDLRAQVGRDRKLELKDALILMEKLCEVVSYLHKQSIVHLDLKPENIICLNDSRIKLIDFGLASCRSLPDLLALDLQNPQGTPWYIAPEQLLGERTDLRCDIYAIGMLFYEMLTGQLPWPRSSKVHIARRRLRHDPTPPRCYNPDIPPQIQTIILRAISRHAKDRYPSIPEMQRDLKCWQRLPVTAGGRMTKRPSLWRRLLPRKTIQLTTEKHTNTRLSERKPQIIAASIDFSTNNDMLTEVRKQALIRSCEVTLVHVIEEESDSHVRRYGLTVEGEQLMAGLEQSVQNLRRFSIDPGIRLIRGEVIDVLGNLSNDLGAELLVLGLSRKKKGLLPGRSVQHRLEKICSCQVVVAAREHFSPATDLKDLLPIQLTEEQVLSCDIFLVDLWFEHLHYHTDLIYQILLYPEQEIDLSETNCRFGHFLSSLDSSGNWEQVTSMLDPIHVEFHKVVARMAKLRSHDHAGLQDLYVNESLPLSCSLKKELGLVSLFLRSQLENQPSPVPFLADASCPVTMPDLACYGPLLRAFNLDQDLCALIEKNDLYASQPDSRGN
ncbi:MAG: protein kinase [Thermodesulfobacteriota bacterium]|nr:protein kinase [Thermodesulfobacteriota bacterium]